MNKHKFKYLRISLMLFMMGCFKGANVIAGETADLMAEIEIPVGTEILSAGNDLIQNGQAISIALYESPLKIEETLDFYRELWADKNEEGIPGMVENRVNDWVIIGRLQDKFQIVLQLKLASPERSSGLLSVMSLEGNNTNMNNEVSMDGLELLSTTQSIDGERKSVLSVYRTSSPIDSVTRKTSKNFVDRGWTMNTHLNAGQNKVLLLNRNSRQLEVVVTQGDDGSTVVVLNEVFDRE